jgi:O-antigen ligase
VPKGRPQGRSTAQKRSRAARQRAAATYAYERRRRQARSYQPGLAGILPEGLVRPRALEVLTEKTGVPGWPLVLGVAGWALVLLLWVGGAIGLSFAFFLGTLLSASIATAWLIGAVVRGKGGLRAGRAGLVVALAVFVPVVFDPHTGDVFNLPKYTLVVIGALVLAGLWVVDAVQHRQSPHWRHGLQWALAAVLVWTAISAFAGMDTHVSLLGDYGSYDGLYAALAFAAVTMATAEAFSAGDVRKVLGALGFAGASVVTIYAVIQLHDTELSGSRWDFIHWTKASTVGNIFSTFGNPNHLAGYLAVVLPIALVLGIFTAKGWPLRVAAGLFTFVVLALIVRSSARGAWVAVIVSGLVLAAFLAPELRRRLALTTTVVGGLVVVAAVGMVVAGKRFISEPLSALFKTGGSTSVQQRFDMWKAAAQMATHHPITGVGPDNYALVFPRYQTAAWVKGLGPNYLVNGSHDIFTTVLADQGFIGLVLFVVLLAVIALRAGGAWRRFRVVERGEKGGQVEIERARGQRMDLAVVTASITAYVVQAVFNVQQIGLTFTFWLLTGLLLVLATQARVPATLRPDILLSTDAVAEEVVAAPAPAWRGRRANAWWQVALAGAIATAAVIVLSVGADGPYRADHAYWASTQVLSKSSSSQTVAAQTYFADIRHAQVLNPWEPRYPMAEGIDLATAATRATTSSQRLSDLNAARSLFAQASRENTLWGEPYYDLASVYGDLSQVQPAKAKADLAAAADAARHALKDNPLNADYSKLLAQIEKGQGALHKHP